LKWAEARAFNSGPKGPSPPPASVLSRSLGVGVGSKMEPQGPQLAMPL